MMVMVRVGRIELPSRVWKTRILTAVLYPHAVCKKYYSVLQLCYNKVQMIYFITGNPHKLKELQAILPGKVTVQHKKLDLTEIQSMDPHEIVSHKLREAYAAVNAPVMVEDVSAGLASLGGLPGPFIKFFGERLGHDALYKLAPDDRVTITCTMGYYDGSEEIIVDGVVHGRTVAPRGNNGFGFDSCIILDGQTQTSAELSPDAKNQLSHRHAAIELMAAALADKL